MNVDKLQEIADFIVGYAAEKGATDSRVVIGASTEVETGVRMGSLEKLEGSDSRSLNFRAFVGQNTANTTTTDLTRNGLRRMIRDTIAMAKASEPDESAGLADSEHFATDMPDLGLIDSNLAKLENARRIELAIEAEKAGLAPDEITNSEGGSFADSSVIKVLANSRGFSGAYGGTMCRLMAGVVAGEGEGMKVGMDYSISRTVAGLRSATDVGEEAAREAISQLGARKVKSQKVPVVYSRKMAARLLGQFVGAASGTHVYRESSFLAGLIDTMVANEIVTIVDDGHIPGGLGSKPFDGEGLPTTRRNIIENGKLATYLIDVYSGRKLGVAPNGGGVSNMYLEPGDASYEDIIGSVDNGLYLTGVSGPGFNATNGNYSLGAHGIWIENGELAYPVSEITVAGNVLEMFKAIEMIGNDLQFDSSLVSPTIKIGEMMVGGS